MFRIMATDGTRQSSSVRFGLTVAYVMFAISGVALLASPILVDVYGEPSYVFAAFLLAGGVLSSFGTCTKRWVGEFTGLPLLIAAFTAYGVTVYAASAETAPYVALANALFLWGVAAFALSRWRVALAAFRLVLALAQHEKSREDDDER